RGLAGEDQSMNSGLDIDKARDMLFGVDDVAGGLREAYEANVDGAGRQALDPASVELLDRFAACGHRGAGDGCGGGRAGGEDGGQQTHEPRAASLVTFVCPPAEIARRAGRRSNPSDGVDHLVEPRPRRPPPGGDVKGSTTSMSANRRSRASRL